MGLQFLTEINGNGMTLKINLPEMDLDQLQALLVQVENEILVKQQAIKEDALAQIKALVELGGLTPADLKKAGLLVSAAKVTKKVAVRFRGPKREEWTGRGQWPRWLKDTGRSKQDFLIGESGSTPYEQEQV